MKKISGVPSLILVPTEALRERVYSFLLSTGVNILQYKPRELVFHNISASHDTERERLSVLSKVLRGDCDAIVTTPSAALSYTIPASLLSTIEVSLSVGSVIAPEDLVEKLISLSFVPMDTVESAGQFARRGGIIDIWHNAEEDPV